MQIEKLSSLLQNWLIQRSVVHFWGQNIALSASPDATYSAFLVSLMVKFTPIPLRT